MQVNLSRNWYGPNDTLYEKSKNPHTFPADWKDSLPKSAEVLPEVKADKPEPAKK